MILFCNFSVPDHDQCDLTVQISQNIQPLRQRLALNLDQILAAVFLAFTDCSNATDCVLDSNSSNL